MTGQRYYEAYFKDLILNQNCHSGELILKGYESGTLDKNVLIKATLTIYQHGQKDYAINSEETLLLQANGISYPLTIFHTFKEPYDGIKDVSVSMPSRSSFTIGLPYDATRRKLSFQLSLDGIEKTLQAKNISFNLSSKLETIGYPIVVRMTDAHHKLLKEFNEHLQPIKEIR